MESIELFSQKGLEAIGSCKFLSKEDTNAVAELRQELQENFEKSPMWRSETLARVSVLNDIKHPTKASKFWQARTEQKVFFENLVALSFDYRRNNVEIKRIEDKINYSSNELDIEDLSIDLEECLFKKQQFETQAHHRVRELKMWSKIKGELDDGTFDADDVETDQLISTTHQSLNRFSSATLPGCQLSPDEAKNIIGLCQTSLKQCEQLGLFNQIMSERKPEELERIMPLLGYNQGTDKAEG